MSQWQVSLIPLGQVLRRSFAPYRFTKCCCVSIPYLSIAVLLHNCFDHLLATCNFSLAVGDWLQRSDHGRGVDHLGTTSSFTVLPPWIPCCLLHCFLLPEHAHFARSYLLPGQLRPDSARRDNAAVEFIPAFGLGRRVLGHRCRLGFRLKTRIPAKDGQACESCPTTELAAWIYTSLC